MDPVPLDTLNSVDRRTFIATLGEAMEHAPWVAEATFAARPFASLAALNQAMIDAVRKAGDERQDAEAAGDAPPLCVARSHGRMSMTSVDLMSAATVSPFCRQSGSAVIGFLTTQRIDASGINTYEEMLSTQIPQHSSPRLSKYFLTSFARKRIRGCAWLESLSRMKCFHPLQRPLTKISLFSRFGRMSRAISGLKPLARSSVYQW